MMLQEWTSFAGSSPELLWIFGASAALIALLVLSAALVLLRQFREAAAWRRHWISTYEAQKVSGHARSWYARQARELALRGGIAQLEGMIEGAGFLVSPLEALHLRHRAYAKASELTLRDVERIYHDPVGRAALQDLARTYKLESDRYLAAARQMEEASSAKPSEQEAVPPIAA